MSSEQTMQEGVTTPPNPTQQPNTEQSQELPRTSQDQHLRDFSIKSLMQKVMEPEPEDVRQARLKRHMEPNRRVAIERDWQRREQLQREVAPYMCKASDKLPKLQPVISQYGQIICSKGNISAIVGDAKSKKTFLCTAIVSSLHRQNENDRPLDIDYRPESVLWIDTEQSLEHIQRVQFRINIMTNQPITGTPSFIRTLALREQKVEDRVSITEKAIDGFRPTLVVIDGISDLMYNTNAVDESEAVVAMLLAWSSKFDCHIMVVLHTNPDSDKARGHIGSALRRKVEAMLFVHRIGDVSVVEPRFCRNAEFERFAFHVVDVDQVLSMHHPELENLGLPERCPLPMENADKEDDCVRVLREELGGIAERKLLCTKLVDMLGVTESYARVKVSRAISRGLLLCDINSVLSIP